MVNSLDNKLLNEQKEGFWPKVARLFGEYYYLAIAFIVPAAIMYLIYLSMGIHPFGDGSVLVLDLNGQYVDFYEALRHFIYGDASLLYSFSRALGGEFMGMYAYYLASPFSYIVALFPQDQILDALLAIFIIKTGMCGFTFGFYLHKTNSHKESFSRVNVVTFSILYSLTAYCVVQQHNSMWIDAVIWLPLITYGIEELIKKGHYKMFTITLAISLMSNFYIGFMTCIYTAIYFFVYYFMHNENYRNNPNREKAHLAKSFLRILFFSILAVAIAAVILLTAYYSLTFGKTNFSTASWDFAMRFDILDMFVKFLPCSYDTVRPEGLPFVYCGMLTLLLLPVYFCSSKFSARERIFSGVLILIFLLSFAISPIDIVWHGFQKPNWLNYRYSFMLCFILLTLAYKGISEIKSTNIKALALPSAIIIALVALAQKTDFATFVLGDGSNDRNHEVGKLLTVECIWFSVILVAVYLIILGGIKIAKNPRNVALVLTVIVAVEVFCNGLSNCLDLGSDVVYTSYNTYSDYIAQLRSATDKIKEQDSNFYRMDELTHRKVNDNMAVNAHGLTNSTSTLNATTINFLQNMGYFAKSHEAQYHGGNIVSDSLLGVKYVLNRYDREKNETEIVREILENENYYKEFLVDGKYTAYKNDFALSLAYAVDSGIYNIDMGDYVSPFDRLNAIITAMLGEDETVEVFKPLEITEEIQSNLRKQTEWVPSEKTNFDFHHIEYRRTSSSLPATIEYVMKFPENASGAESHYVYFYMPSEFQRALTLTTRKMEYDSIFGNSTMRVISLGEYKVGIPITATVSYDLDKFYIAQNVGIFYYLDEEVFYDAMERLSQSQLKIDENYSDDHITGTITTTENDRMIFTSIPYDEGWQVFVDGKRVATHGILGDSGNENETAGALIAFSISEAGEHTVELKYRPRAFTVGIAITTVGIIALILIIIFEKKVNRIADRILCPIIIPEYVPEEESEISGDHDPEQELEEAEELPPAEPLDTLELDPTIPADTIPDDSDSDGGN